MRLPLLDKSGRGMVQRTDIQETILRLHTDGMSAELYLSFMKCRCVAPGETA